MENIPKISIVMTCYNHEKFVGEAIESVLDQTYEDFELIIVNDGSQDNTQKIIDGYSDSRIISKTQINSGPSSAINNGIRIARGDYIAFMSGDDLMFPDRLNTQLNYSLSKEIDIVFNLPKIIDDKSRIIPNEFCPQFFGIDFYDTVDLFNKLFKCGNFLCAPSCFAKQSAIKEIGKFNIGLIQLQDFDYWIRACKKKLSIKSLSHPLIMYRYLPGKNLSDERNLGRMKFENSIIYESFLENVPNDLFVQAFQKEINFNDNYDKMSIELEKTFLFYYNESISVKKIGVERIIKQLGIPELFQKIIERKNFSIEEFYASLKRFQFDDVQRDTRLLFVYDNLKTIFEKIGCLTVKILLGDKRIIRILRKKIDNGNTKNLFYFAELLNSPIRNYLAWIKNRAVYLIFVLRYFYNFKNISNKYFLHKIRKRRYGKSLHLFEYSSMYDYCKKNGEIIFQDKKEKIKFDKPKIFGSFNKSKLQTGYGYCPSPYISVINDAILTGSTDLIFSKEGFLLNDELVSYVDEGYGFKNDNLKFIHNNKVIVDITKDNKIYIDEGILISCDHHKNYFHWIIESLPKLAMVNEIIGLKDIPLLVPGGLHQNLIFALNKVNINMNPIIFLDEDYDYLVRKLIYPSPISKIMDRYQGSVKYNQDIVLSKKWISKVVTTINKSCSIKNDISHRIYIHRSGSVRKLENQKEIEQILSNYNFRIIEPERISLDEQIELFTNASIVIAPTGAALTNILFCKPGTEIIIFMSNHENTNYYFWNNLGSINGLDIKIIAGRRTYKVTNYNSVHDDYSIDINVILGEINKIVDLRGM